MEDESRLTQGSSTGPAAGHSEVKGDSAQDGLAANTETSSPTVAAGTGSEVKPTTHAGSHEGRRPSTPFASPTTSPATAAAAAGAGFVAPSSYLRPVAGSRAHPLSAAKEGSGFAQGGIEGSSRGAPGEQKVMHPLDKEQTDGLVSRYRPSCSHAGYHICFRKVGCERTADQVYATTSER